MDDASIIDLFNKRDEQAIAQIKSKYNKLCFCVTGNFLSSHEDMEECINSAYMEIWSKIPPEHHDNLKLYLCRIVRNLSINKLKYNTADKRNSARTVPIDELADCIPSDDNIASNDALANAISRFLRSQDEIRRKVFVRRYWYGDPICKIAEYYDLNEKTVATYLFRTRKKLKAFLQKEGYHYD